MQAYLGFGFDATDIDTKDMLKLIETYNKKEFEKYYEERNKNIKENKWEKEELIEDYIEEKYQNGYPEYIESTINQNENKTENIGYIVTTYGKYVVFDSIRFIDDNKRSKYIRNETDFIKMIAKYLDTSKITFGNIWTGNDYTDDNIFLD